MRYVPVEFMTLTAVEDEFSRAMLSKQPGKGLRQSVPDWRCGQGRRQGQGESMIWDTLAFDPDDMRYSCSWCGLFAEQCSGSCQLHVF
ncbi:hypothetical protein ACFX11_020032 [Malus domestica]